MSVGLLNKVSRKTRNNFRPSFHLSMCSLYTMCSFKTNNKVIILSKRGEKYCLCKKYHAHKNFIELKCQKEKSILHQVEL